VKVRCAASQESGIAPPHSPTRTDFGMWGVSSHWGSGHVATSTVCLDPPAAAAVPFEGESSTAGKDPLRFELTWPRPQVGSVWAGQGMAREGGPDGFPVTAKPRAQSVASPQAWSAEDVPSLQAEQVVDSEGEAQTFELVSLNEAPAKGPVLTVPSHRSPQSRGAGGRTRSRHAPTEISGELGLGLAAGFWRSMEGTVAEQPPFEHRQWPRSACDQKFHTGRGGASSRPAAVSRNCHGRATAPEDEDARECVSAHVARADRPLRAKVSSLVCGSAPCRRPHYTLAAAASRAAPDRV